MARNDIRMDRFGRYLLVNPLTGKEEPFTRATTVAKTLDDTYYLEQWQLRQVAYGLGQRPDLVALAAGADGPDDKDLLSDVVEQAKHAAASSKKANIGTALHGLTHKIERGDPDVHVPEMFRDLIAAYRTMVSLFGFTWEYIEVTVMHPDIRVAGSFDRVGQWQGSALPIVADLKTGESLEYSKIAIAQQLAIYANAPYRIDPDRGNQPVEFEARNTDEALVLHLPVSGADPKVYRVDIKTGWELVQNSLDIRKLRRSKGADLFEEVKPDAAPMPAPAASPTAEPDEEALKQRVTKLVAHEEPKAMLLRLWSSDVPTFRQGGLTPDHLRKIEQWVKAVEKEYFLD